MLDPTSNAERNAQSSDGRGKVEYWLNEIDQAQKRHDDWHKRAWKVIERYRDEKKRSSVTYNILWSNTQTLGPALYSHTPVPDIRGRYKDKDPITDQVCEVLERGATHSIDAYDFDGLMRAVVQDYTLPGRGVARVMYEAEFETVTPPQPVQPVTQHVDPYSGSVTPIYPQGTQFDRQDIGPYVVGPPEQRKKSEKTTCAYWFWEDFLHGPGRKWNEIKWVGFRGFYSRDELIKSFGKVGNKVNLDYTPKNVRDKYGESVKDSLKKATVWELWDADSKKVIYISPGYVDDVLMEKSDPLGLEGFFPCPEPVSPIITNDTLIPIPLYCQYQDQAEELDEITGRINKLVKELKSGGAYNSVNEELERIKNAKDGEFIPIQGIDPSIKLSDMVLFWPIEQIASVLLGLYQQRDNIINTIYQITGLADIVRGQSDPRETAAAQKIKGHFANLRLSDMQNGIERFARDLIRLQAEIMAEHFEPETLQAMTSKQVTPEMLQIMRADGPRSYLIDIETDSTIEPNADEEQQNATDLITAIGAMMQQFAPFVQSGIMPMDVAKAIMMFGLRRFKNIRDIEDAIEMIGTQPPPPPSPSPQQIKAQTDNNKIQADMAMQQQDMMFQANQNAANRHMELTKALMDFGNHKQDITNATA